MTVQLPEPPSVFDDLEHITHELEEWTKTHPSRRRRDPAEDFVIEEGLGWSGFLDLGGSSRLVPPPPSSTQPVVEDPVDSLAVTAINAQNQIAKGENLQAFKSLLKAVDLMRELHGPDSSRVLVATCEVLSWANETALALARNKHSNAAQQLLRHSRDIARSLPPDQALLAAQTSGNMGVVIAEGGDGPRAWDYLVEALATIKVAVRTAVLF